MRHTTHFDKKRPGTNNNNDCKQQKHKHHADSKQSNFAPNKPAASTQYGGGKSSTLEPLWNKLRKTKTKLQQLTTPDLFDPKGRDWLSAHQINSCLTHYYTQNTGLQCTRQPLGQRTWSAVTKP